MHHIISKQSLLEKGRGLMMLLRPKQWIKNGFVLAPLIFSGAFAQSAALYEACYAVFLFCLVSSATYVMNDLHDIEQDKQHPIKSHQRPLATGLVSVRGAVFLLIVLYAILGIGLWHTQVLAPIIIFYAILNIAYTIVLKNKPVVDIFVISIGFVLRVYAGGVAISVPVSSWMVITTLCLALYLASIKRRQELSQMGVDGRQVLSQYSVQLVDRYAEMSATCALVFYSMFVMSVKPQLAFSIPLVLFGLFRYWYIVDLLDQGESPTDTLLSDGLLLVTVLVWAFTCTWIIWLGMV